MLYRRNLGKIVNRKACIDIGRSGSRRAVFLDESHCVSNFFAFIYNRSKRFFHDSLRGNFSRSALYDPFRIVSRYFGNTRELIADFRSLLDFNRDRSKRLFGVRSWIEGHSNHLCSSAFTRLRSLGSIAALGHWLLFLFLNITNAGKHEWREFFGCKSKGGSSTFGNFLEAIRAIVVSHEFVALESKTGNGDGNRYAKVYWRTVFLN